MSSELCLLNIPLYTISLYTNMVTWIDHGCLDSLGNVFSSNSDPQASSRPISRHVRGRTRMTGCVRYVCLLNLLLPGLSRQILNEHKHLGSVHNADTRATPFIGLECAIVRIVLWI